ncbi:MAG: hypothetical protein RMK57_00190 [Bryobacterales bacterium]|nr:hypothetical protein [Bryobacteraceae bacterium]MDW8352924.1 hypothetical protein [Bryobacterales bacterium]
MRLIRASWVAASGFVTLLSAATLERLSLDELIEKSTAVVRGRVHSPRATFHGSLIYTHWTVDVLERWKGPDVSRIDVVVPGGVAGGLRQTFSGAPQMQPGDEYVLFLWTGRSGVTHVLGLSQGLFAVTKEANGAEVASRPASKALMLDPSSGKLVSDGSVRWRLADLRARVVASSGGAK